jgi:hypothetical protein
MNFSLKFNIQRCHPRESGDPQFDLVVTTENPLPRMMWIPAFAGMTLGGMQ